MVTWASFTRVQLGFGGLLRRAGLPLLTLALLTLPAGPTPADAPATPPGYGATRVTEIPITGTIEMGLAPFVERAIAQAEREGADAILLRVDTFGGRIDAAVRIRDAILDCQVPTIAWVSGRAISAGALISLAAKTLVMNEGASIGAAEPIHITPGGESEPTGEKTVSYMRGEMRATAEATGRDARVAEAMVDADIAIDGVVATGKLLTLTGHEALDLGVADKLVTGRGELLRYMDWDEGDVVRASPTWSEGLVRFLTHPIMAGLLLSIGGLALLLELRTPGLGIPGLIGVICLALYFGSHYLVNLAGNVELLLFLGGLLLIVLEIFVIPGFGAAGIAGIVMLVAGLLLSRVAPHGGMADIRGALLLLIASFFVTLILFLSLLKYLPQARWMGGIVLETRQDHAVGFHADQHEGEPLVGKIGHCLSDLRPAGVIELEGRRLDVVTTGDYVDRGSRVKVIKISGNRVVVEPLESGEAEGSPSQLT